MRTALKLAYRNLTGTGLRTWLNVAVLSFSFVIIIWLKGIMTGWDRQAKTDMKTWQIGEGQLWHRDYDPYDPASLYTSHGEIPESLNQGIKDGNIVPQLLLPGNVFPRGRMLPVVLNGIDPRQRLLSIPSRFLDTACEVIPAIIGSMTAKMTALNKGDFVTIRWRDANGTFDAAEIVITGVFTCNVPAVDANNIYIPLEKLRELARLQHAATLLTFREPSEAASLQQPDWVFKPVEELTRSVDEVIKTKTIGQSILYLILLMLALLAVFDTQVFSIFRRQREIGTYIALGFTKAEVIGLFTIEGTMHSLLATIAAFVYGFPLLWYQAKHGWTIPIDAGELGMAIAQTIYPVFSMGLVISTILLVALSTAIVSYFPSRKIARMSPTDALKGKLQ